MATLSRTGAVLFPLFCCAVAVALDERAVTDQDLLALASATKRIRGPKVLQNNVAGSLFEAVQQNLRLSIADPKEQLETWHDSGRAVSSEMGREKMDGLAQSLTPERYHNRLIALLDATKSESRWFDSPGAFQAEAHLEKAMKSMGLEVSMDHFGLRHAGSSHPIAVEDKSFTSFPKLEFTEAQVPGSRSPSGNVIGVLNGTDLKHELVVIGAHYDSVNWEALRALSGLDHVNAKAPGADDNGSGVAALLEMAAIIAQQGPQRRTIAFVAFSCEEQGLLGSEHFVQKRILTKSFGELKNVIIMDEIGFPGRSQFLGHAIFETKGTSPGNQAMVDTFATSAQHEAGVSGPYDVNYHGFDSDHVSFLNKGYPTVLLIERDNMWNQEQRGHSARDTRDARDDSGALNVDSDFGSAMARVAMRSLLCFASPASAHHAMVRSHNRAAMVSERNPKGDEVKNLKTDAGGAEAVSNASPVASAPGAHWMAHGAPSWAGWATLAGLVGLTGLAGAGFLCMTVRAAKI